MRILLLVALTSMGLIGPAQGRELPCILSPLQVQETFFAVRHEAWTQCDCTHARNARSFARCYRQAVRQLGTDGGLPEGCIRELSTGEGVHSTCGRPKAVACCTITVIGAEYCSVEPSAKRCVPPRSGGACINTGQQDCFTGEGADSNCGCIGE